MPLPLILAAAAGAAATVGIGTGIHGAVKMKDAKETMEAANAKHNESIKIFEKNNTEASKCMDDLGKKELEILESFDEFSKVIAKINDKPEFKTYSKNGVKLPEYDPEEIKQVSVGAGVLLGGLSGAALGTAGGFAAAGATTAAVMALGTASTGTAISALSGAAATNATLAALGGGAIAAGGGGIALGTTVLGAATLGVGLMVGGIIFSVTGSSLSNKADEAWLQAKREAADVEEICTYLKKLMSTSTHYRMQLQQVHRVYNRHLDMIINLVDVQGKRDWNDYSENEVKYIENTVLLVQLLYYMCKVQLVVKGKADNDMNQINKVDIDKAVKDAQKILAEIEA